MAEKIIQKDLDSFIKNLHNTAEWKKEVKRVAEKEMASISKSFIDRFLNHPVTKELMEGPNGSNISGTLGGYSNLFGFIGFYEGENPIDPLLRLLEKYSVTVYGRRGSTVVSVQVPELKDAYQVTPMPWATGRSWARGIEVGISGLGQYLAIDAVNSRSGEGIQSGNQLRGGSFTRTSYLSGLFKTYNDSIKKLKNQFK